jgi:hypothetical protein
MSIYENACDRFLAECEVREWQEKNLIRSV